MRFAFRSLIDSNLFFVFFVLQLSESYGTIDCPTQESVC